jgi:hypothetical protein
MRPDRESECDPGRGETTPGLLIWFFVLLEGTAFGSNATSDHALGVAIPQGSNSGESVMVADEGEWLMW